MKLNMKPFKLIIYPLIIILFHPPLALARIEYAIKHRILNCTACHVSPFGAGPKNIDGKLYASRLDQLSPWSKQDMFGLDVRGISYYPKHGTQSRQGSALMTSTGSMNIPIISNPLEREIRFIGSYSLGVVNQGPRDIYGQWRSSQNDSNPTYIQVGRFNVPFGAQTDEHRTFTRLLTRTGIFDYEFGASISRNYAQNIHYDFAVTNGERTGGGFSNNSPSNKDATTGYLANIRWMPSSLPILLGITGEYQKHLSPNPSPNSWGAYFALSLDRVSNHKVLGSIVAEGVYARHFSNPTSNSNITRYFIPQTDTAYLGMISDKPAVAWYSQFNWEFSERWTALYRYEKIVFDPRFSGDRFLRHGLGLKYSANTNLIFLTRYEIADVGRPEIKDQNVYAAENAFWLMAQLWL